MADTALRLPRRSQLDWNRLAATLLLLSLGALVLVPLGMMVAATLGFAPGMPAEWEHGLFDAWIRALHQNGLGDAILNTLTLSVTYIVVSMPIAVALAWLLARTDLPASRWLEFGFWVSFFIPPLAIVQGYVLLFEPSSGVFNKLWEAIFGSAGPFNIYGWWGIVLAHLATNAISAKVMLITPAFRNIDGSLEEAALIAGDSVPTMVRRIVIPVLAPALLVTLVLSIVRSMESFEIELVLGTPNRIEVYSTHIYRLIRASTPDYQGASVLGVMIVIVMTGLALAQRRATAGRSFETLGGKLQSHRVSLGRARWWLFALVAGILAILVVVPLFSLVVGTVMTMYGYFEIPDPWTLDHWRAILADPVFADSLSNTLTLAVGTALCVTVVGFTIAYVIHHSHGVRGHLLDLLSWVPFSMPGVLLSFALLSAVLQIPILQGLYGSRILLVIALALGGLTLSVQLMRSSLMQLGRDIEEASIVAGGSGLLTLRRVVLPLVGNAMIVVAMISFIAASVNVSHLALLYTSETRPLSIMQLEYLTEGRYEAASVLGVIVVGITVVLAILVRIVGFRAAPGHG
jgi:iron(III) transport system permease protein